jgi:hypothetical protein
MERIDFCLYYKSGTNNGWPLINIYVNNQCIKSFEANGQQLIFSCEVPEGPVSLIVEHWGKNPITDSTPTDKFFELTDMVINDVPCKKMLNNFIKKIKPAPWDDNPEIVNGDLYLGHNGTLELRLASPVKSWLQQSFGGKQTQIQGQETTWEVLLEAKKFFKIIQS